ncbi:MAG: ferrous iron transport protein B, partial [Bacteroidaceae bacterium]|nr:ferrous iron transport protein B [Bacteroidaceae bacterium]
AACIDIDTEVRAPSPLPALEQQKRRDIPHPRIGEEGDPRHQHRAQVRQDEHAQPLTFALVGNQNCGKTTLFNQLTGANQHVGNFPGVTVDCKDGTIKGYPHATITDLPGIYSLSPYTQEEVVTRSFIIGRRPSCIINIVDATNIERNLYLTMQLMQLDTPMVLALNMMDEVEEGGGSIRINRMEQFLGIPVIPISAARNEGVVELVEHAMHVAAHREKPGRMDFCSPDDHGGSVHRGLHAIMHLIEPRTAEAGIPLRFAAGKVVEGDPLVIDALHLTDTEHEVVERILCQMERERGMDRRAAIADMRFSFISRVCAQTVARPRESRERARSRRMDRILTGRWTALPTFVCIMAAVFYLTFNSVGAWLQESFETLISLCVSAVDATLARWDIAPVVRSLVVDGVLGGVGTVLSFLPLILLLFFFLSLLEDSGYMARIAFVMDRLLRRIGLSGRSVVPLLIGFGCSVPGIMASRTLPSHRDRKLTVLLTPFMSCTAKIPVYAFLIAAFFPARGAWVMSGLYLVGILVGIVVALVGRRTLFRGEPVPFVMEL